MEALSENAEIGYRPGSADQTSFNQARGFDGPSGRWLNHIRLHHSIRLDQSCLQFIIQQMSVVSWVHHLAGGVLAASFPTGYCDLLRARKLHRGMACSNLLTGITPASIIARGSNANPSSLWRAGAQTAVTLSDLCKLCVRSAAGTSRTDATTMARMAMSRNNINSSTAKISPTNRRRYTDAMRTCWKNITSLPGHVARASLIDAL